MFDTPAACEVGVERGASSGQQLQAGAMASTRPAERLGPVVLLLCFHGEPGHWMRLGLLPWQELDADGLLEEGHACRVEGLPCSSVGAERGGGVCTVFRH